MYWSHLRTQGTAIVGLSENRENQSSLYAVILYHTLTIYQRHVKYERNIFLHFWIGLCQIAILQIDVILLALLWIDDNLSPNLSVNYIFTSFLQCSEATAPFRKAHRLDGPFV